MTDSFKTRLLEALLGPIEYRDDPMAKRIMEECAASDFQVIEPILADLEQQAELRGRFAQLLEMAHERESRCV